MRQETVRFLDKTSIRVDGKTGLANLWKEVSMTEDLGENDELIIVYLDNSFSSSEVETIEEFEYHHPNTRVMSYKHLMFNITKHELVPPHKLYVGSKFELFDKSGTARRKRADIGRTTSHGCVFQQVFAAKAQRSC